MAPVAYLDVSDSTENCFDRSGMMRMGSLRNFFLKFLKAFWHPCDHLKIFVFFVSSFRGLVISAYYQRSGTRPPGVPARTTVN